VIGITIKTHTTKAIANEAVAGGSTGPPPDLSSVVVVPDEATPLFFNVPGLTRGESAMLYGLGCQRCDEWRAPANHEHACPKGPIAGRKDRLKEKGVDSGRKDRLQRQLAVKSTNINETIALRPLGAG